MPVMLSTGKRIRVSVLLYTANVSVVFYLFVGRCTAENKYIDIDV